MVGIDTNFMILCRAGFAAPVGTIALWAGENDFDVHGAVTTHMAEPHLEAVLCLVSTFAGATAMTATAAMFAMAVFAPVR